MARRAMIVGSMDRPLGRAKESCKQAATPVWRRGDSTLPDRNALKAKYLDCFAARTSSAQTLVEVIKNLLWLGAVRATLYRWGVAAGYSPATVRSLLSRAFCALGLRERKVGAGRKPSAEALELLAHARRQYRSQALRVLRAAYRAGKTQDGAPHDAGKGRESVPMLIVAPQLPISGLIVGPQLGMAGQESNPLKRGHTDGPRGRVARLAARDFRGAFQAPGKQRQATMKTDCLSLKLRNNKR